MRRAALALTGVLTVIAACAPSLPEPKLGPHTDEEPVTVPYPPPPARVETVPGPPPELRNPVWIDGEWQWRGRRWLWQAGQWQAPLPGQYYAPPATVRLSDGTLVYYAGGWKIAAKGP